MKIEGVLLVRYRDEKDDDGAEKRRGVNMGVARFDVVDKKCNSMLVKQ